MTMSKWQRIEATIRGEAVDRTPLSMWVHYHLQDRGPQRLAESTYRLYREFDLDLLKLTPSGLYSVQDWGAAIRYSRHDWVAPVMNEPVIRSAADWFELGELDVNQGALERELEMIQAVKQRVGDEAPILMTIFSPLTLAWKLLGNEASPALIQYYLKEEPEALHAALATITRVTRNFVSASLQAGVDGFFFASQLANFELLSREEQYREFGRRYDLEILQHARQQGARVNMLHLCRSQLMFSQLADYPVEFINWNNHGSGTSIRQARALTNTALSGGLDNQSLHLLNPLQVSNMVRAAVQEGSGGGFLLAPTCVIDARTPGDNLQAIRQTLQQLQQREPQVA